MVVGDFLPNVDLQDFQIVRIMLVNVKSGDFGSGHDHNIEC